MKTLKICVPLGYKMLEKGFEINFLTKTRVDKDGVNSDLIELENNFYYPIETVFIGKNSSGKTTTLSLINLSLLFLKTGRIYNDFLPEGRSFELNIIYYEKDYIYSYEGKFKKEIAINNEYLIIENEILKKSKLKQSYKKDLSNVFYQKDPDFEPNVGGDTSSVLKARKENELIFSMDFLSYYTAFFDLYHTVLGDNAFNCLVRLFDDSIVSIKPHIEDNKTNGYYFERVDFTEPMLVTGSYLESILSAGTLRGINLYGSSIISFKMGGTILVDEIEKSFNRNLIENLFIMFNDSSINKKGANIVYSTYYSELLDNNSRCDNVNVLHRFGNTISVKNMKLDYDVRTDILKSGQFNQNVFDTLINYDHLMELKEAIRGNN